MKEHRVSIAEYNHITAMIYASFSGIIRYDGHIFQDVGDEFTEIIVCAAEIDILSGNYEWKQVVTPFFKSSVRMNKKK